MADIIARRTRRGLVWPLHLTQAPWAPAGERHDARRWSVCGCRGRVGVALASNPHDAAAATRAGGAGARPASGHLISCPCRAHEASGAVHRSVRRVAFGMGRVLDTSLLDGLAARGRDHTCRGSRRSLMELHGTAAFDAVHGCGLIHLTHMPSAASSIRAAVADRVMMGGLLGESLGALCHTRRDVYGYV